ncbi:MAG: DegT/DnrJ/EryC1/StrS family aminotransferase [Parcubacteria group bacterium]
MTNQKIPWAKPDIGKDELFEIVDSFKTEWLTMGPKTKKLEENLAGFLNVPFAIAVSNGTVALDMALKVLGIKTGDEVIVPAMTYFATVSAICQQGAIPVFVDIEDQTFNLNPAKIEEAISPKTKAVVFIDYGGNPADYDRIVEIAQKHNIAVLQDGAQSLGGTYKGRPAGAQANISTMSFHMAKVMTTVEGGMIFTHDPKIKEQLCTMRNQGEQAGCKYKHTLLGTNARLTDLQAAIGLAQFEKLPKYLQARKQIAKQYDRIFNLKAEKIKTISTNFEDNANAYFFYPILIDKRDQIAEALRAKYDIDTRVAYSMPVYDQPVFASRQLPFRKMDCPVAEWFTSRVLNLPIFFGMTEEEINRVAWAVLVELN